MSIEHVVSRGSAEPDVPAAVPSFGEALRTWLKLGLIGFGGPAGQIALMHRIVVDEKRWIDEPRFLHALNYCMLLPGPEAQQLAVYLGWLLHRSRGRSRRRHPVRAAWHAGDAGAQRPLRPLCRAAAGGGPVLGAESSGAGGGRRGGAAHRPAGAAWPGDAGDRRRRVRRHLLSRRAVSAGHPRRRRHRLLRRPPAAGAVRRPWRARLGGGDTGRRRRPEHDTPERPALAARARHRPRLVVRTDAGGGDDRRSLDLHRHRRVLQQDGGGHLRRRLRGAVLRGAAGGRTLRLAFARGDADRPRPRRDDARAADHGGAVRRLPRRLPPPRRHSIR